MTPRTRTDRPSPRPIDEHSKRRALAPPTQARPRGAVDPLIPVDGVRRLREDKGLCHKACNPCLLENPVLSKERGPQYRQRPSDDSIPEPEKVPTAIHRGDDCRARV